MATYTHITVYEADLGDDPDDPHAPAKALFAESLKVYPENTLVDEQLRDADGNVIEHRS